MKRIKNKSKNVGCSFPGGKTVTSCHTCSPFVCIIKPEYRFEMGNYQRIEIPFNKMERHEVKRVGVPLLFNFVTYTFMDRVTVRVCEEDMNVEDGGLYKC